ncbi:MAG: FixH family protein [Planctomycetota bacterium]
MESNSASTSSREARKASYRWPLIIVGFLAGHMGAMALAVNIAGRDNGNAVLPDYYERALAWDEMREKAADSAQLGWDVFVNASALTDAAGRRTLRVEVLDRFREPVKGAQVAVRYWHRAEGKAREATLSAVGEGAKGVYEAEVPMARSGLYACDLAIELGELLHVSERELNVAGVLLGGEEADWK